MLSNSSNTLPDTIGGNGIFSLKSLPRFVVSAVLALVVYVLVTRVINPGFFDPLVPNHSDTWRYFAYSKSDFSLADLQAPRPLMLIALKLMGMLDSFSWFVAFVLAPAVLLPVALLRSAEIVLERRVSWLLQAAYFALCFSLASFYELQTLDFGGCIAGLVACAALLAFRRLALSLKADKATIGNYVVPFLLVWVSMECKPTYGLVLAAVPLFFSAMVGWRRSLLQAAGVVAVVMMVLLKDRLLGSPFVGADPSASAASYRLGGGLGLMLNALWFYVKAMLPMWAWPLVLLGLYGAAREKGLWTAATLLVLAVLAVAPMIAIPNNQMPMYSWFGASLLLLPVALFTATRLQHQSRLLSLGKSTLFWMLMLAAIVAIARSKQDLRFWYGFNQKANAQTLQGIDALANRMLPGQRILIAGPLNAHSPFRNDDFINLRLGYSVDWTIVVPEQHTSLMPFSDSRRHVASRDLGEISTYDVVALFNESGRLVHVGSGAEFADLTKPELINQLLCRQGGKVDTLKEVACLTPLNEDAAARAAQAPQAAAAVTSEEGVVAPPGAQ